jgi:hypothetical protein
LLAEAPSSKGVGGKEGAWGIDGGDDDDDDDDDDEDDDDDDDDSSDCDVDNAVEIDAESGCDKAEE